MDNNLDGFRFQPNALSSRRFSLEAALDSLKSKLVEINEELDMKEGFCGTSCRRFVNANGLNIVPEPAQIIGIIVTTLAKRISPLLVSPTRSCSRGQASPMHHRSPQDLKL